MLTSFTDGATDADYVYDAYSDIRRRVKSVVFLWSKVHAACDEELQRVRQETLRPW